MASDNEASCEGDPNFAVICDFFGKFGNLCGLSPIDFLNLQEMLENTHEVAPALVELHIKLMRKIRKSVAAERWERAIVNICHKYNSQDAWEVERFGYKKSRLGCKLRILKHLLEMQFDLNQRFKNDVNKMSAEELRTQPDGRDKTGHVYWFQSDDNCHIRVYMEDPDEETWAVVAKNREGLVSLISELDTNDTVKIGSEPIVNEDSNSLEIEKPILDTGQHDSNSESSKPSKKSSEEEDDSTDSITQPKPKESIQITDSDSNSILPNNSEVKKITEKPELLGEEEEELEEEEEVDEEEEVEEEEELEEEGEEEEEEEEEETTKVAEKPIVMKSEEIPKVEQKEEVKPVEVPQKIMGLRLKPITELLNQPNLISVEEKKIEFSGIKDKYIRNDPFTSQMCNRKAVKSAGFVELYKPDLKRALEYDIAEPCNMKRPRTDRPTLLGNKKKYSMYEEDEDFDDEVGEEIEEPLMLVTGEGSGKDNNCGNESPIVGETIEEPVLYFYGTGTGEDCETGNENEKNEEPLQSTAGKSKEVDSAKNSFTIGTVLDSKTTKKEVFRSPPKKSRWDIEEGTNVAKMVDKFENISKSENQETTPPKKTSFFFGRGSGFAFKSPNVSPIKSTGLSFGSSFVKNSENNEESNVTNTTPIIENNETKQDEEEDKTAIESHTNNKVLEGKEEEELSKEENTNQICDTKESSNGKEAVKDSISKEENEHKEPSKQESNLENKLKSDENTIVETKMEDVVQEKIQDQINEKKQIKITEELPTEKQEKTVQEKECKEDKTEVEKMEETKSNKQVNIDSAKVDQCASLSKEVPKLATPINSGTNVSKEPEKLSKDNENSKDNNAESLINKEDLSRKRKSSEEEIPIKLSKCDIDPQKDTMEGSSTIKVQEKDSVNASNESCSKEVLFQQDLTKTDCSLAKPLVENLKVAVEENVKAEVEKELQEITDDKEKPVVDVKVVEVAEKRSKTIENVVDEKVEEKPDLKDENIIKPLNDENVASENTISNKKKPVHEEILIVPSDLPTKNDVCLLENVKPLNSNEPKDSEHSKSDSKTSSSISIPTEMTEKPLSSETVNTETIPEKPLETITKLETPVSLENVIVNSKLLEPISGKSTISDTLPFKSSGKDDLNKKDSESNATPKDPIREGPKLLQSIHHNTEKSKPSSHLVSQKPEQTLVDRKLVSTIGDNKKVELHSKLEVTQDSSKDMFAVDLSKTSNLIKTSKESVAKPICVLPKKKSFKIDNLLGSKTGMHDKAVKVETNIVLSQPLAVEKSLVNLGTPLDFSKSDSTNIPSKAVKSKITEYKNVELVQNKNLLEDKCSIDGLKTLTEDVSLKKAGNTSQSKVPEVENIVGKISNSKKNDDSVATGSMQNVDNNALVILNETKCDSKIEKQKPIKKINLPVNPVLVQLESKKDIAIERIDEKLPEVIKEKKDNENTKKTQIEKVETSKLLVDTSKIIMESTDRAEKLDVSKEKDLQKVAEKKNLDKEVKLDNQVVKEVKPEEYTKDAEKRVSENCGLPPKSDIEKNEVEENSKRVDNNLEIVKEKIKVSEENLMENSNKTVDLQKDMTDQTEESAIVENEKSKDVKVEHSDIKSDKDQPHNESHKIEETTKKEITKPPKKEIQLPVRQSQRRKNTNLDTKVNTPTKEVIKDSKQENKTQGNNKRAKIEEVTIEKDDNCQVDVSKAAVEEKKAAEKVVEEAQKTESKSNDKSVDLVSIEKEIVPSVQETTATKKDNLKNIQQGPTRTTRSRARNKNEPKEEVAIEPVCVKKKASTLTQDTEDKSCDIPLEAIGVKDEEIKSEVTEEEEKPKKATLTSLSFDYTGTPSPPPAEVRLTRKRGRLSPAPEVVEGDTGGKRRKKARGKRVNADLRKSIEEQKKKEVSSSEEDQSQNAKESKPKPKAEGDAKKKDGPKKRRTLLGLDIPDLSALESTPPGVRQSRRIAQIKIKEEAERRKIEEMTMAEIQEKHRKKSKKDEDKDYKAEKRKRNKGAVTEDETTNDADFDDKKKRKKNKPKNPKFDQYNPWKSSSDSSSESNEEEEEEYEEEDDADAPLKSDHEFSPESDLEDGSEIQPLKRARTVRKEDAVEEEVIDDTNCQKCGKSDHPEWILLCDVCDAGWHCSCLRPALLVIPEGDWHCPPCQHLAVVKRFRDRLEEFDKKVSKRQIEVRRKERLAYVGISLDNVLPSKEHDETHKPKNKRKQHNSEYESTGSESSSGSTATSTDSEDEPIYQLRQRRQAHSYRFNDYDDLINSAIREEVEAVRTTTQIPVENKDIVPVVASVQEGIDQPENLTTKPELQEGTITATPQIEKKDDEGSEEETIQPVKKFIGKKKHRKLNSLDDSSDDDQDSDEDFKGDSSDEEDEDEFDEEVDTDSSDLDTRRGKRKGPVRRSTRARVSRYERGFINDDSEDEAPRRKKTRSIWDESESEESDRSWGRRKKKGSSSKKTSSFPKKKKSKKKKTDDDSDVEVYRKKKPKIKYGGLDSEEEEDVGRKTRGKKITYVDALGSDSDDDLRRKNAIKDEDSEDEFVLNEEEDFVDEVERDSDDSNDDGPLVFPSVIKAKSKKGKGKGGIKRIKRAQGEEEEALFPPLPEEIKKKEETNIDNTNSDDKPNPIEQIIQSLENMDEKEMKEMMEDEEYANKQLQLVAAQLEKEKRRKEMEAKAKALEPMPPVIPTVVGNIPTTVPNVVSNVVPIVVPSVVPNIVPNVVPHIIPNTATNVIPNVVSNNISNVVPSSVLTGTPPAVSAVAPTVLPSSIPSIIPSVIPTFLEGPIDASKLNLSADDKTPKRRGRKPKSALTSPETSQSGNSLLPTTPFGEKISGESTEFTEMVPLGLNPDGTPKKRRGRGKGKKTLEKEAAAAAAAAANSSLSSFTSSKDSGDSSEPPISTSQDGMSSKTASPADSPMHGGKLGVAAAPQPFTQSQPVPSVITRMLQSQPGKASYPVGAMGYDMYGPEQRSDGPSPPIPSAQGPPFIGGPRGVLPGPGYRPPLNHYPVIRGAPPPHRLRSPGPQNIPPSIYHAHHPMDPSPSGGGPIPVSNASPAPSASPVGSKGPTPPPPPYVRPPLVRFPPGGGPLPRHPHILPQHLQARPYPGMPPNFHYGNFPPPGGDENGPPPGPFPYPEQFPPDGPSEGPKNYDEDNGEFGGLVSYFSSQREDDLDS